MARRKRQETDDEDKIETVADLMLFLESECSAAPPKIDGFTIEDVLPAIKDRVGGRDGRVRWTPQVFVDVLNDLANCGVIYKACQKNGVSAIHFQLVRRDNEELAELCEQAQDLYRQRISTAIHNRALEGWLEPEYYLGKICGFKRKYSDRMLEMQAKRHMPEYRDKSDVNHNHTGGVLLIQSDGVMDQDEWYEETRQVKRITSEEVDK